MWSKFPPSIKTLVIVMGVAAYYGLLALMDTLFGDVGQVGVLLASAILLLYFVIKTFDGDGKGG